MEALREPKTDPREPEGAPREPKRAPREPQECCYLGASGIHEMVEMVGGDCVSGE